MLALIFILITHAVTKNENKLINIYQEIQCLGLSFTNFMSNNSSGPASSSKIYVLTASDSTNKWWASKNRFKKWDKNLILFDHSLNGVFHGQWKQLYEINKGYEI